MIIKFRKYRRNNQSEHDYSNINETKSSSLGPVCFGQETVTAGWFWLNVSFKICTPPHESNIDFQEKNLQTRLYIPMRITYKSQFFFKSFTRASKSCAFQTDLHTSTVQHHHAYLALSWACSPINSLLIHATSLPLYRSLIRQWMPWQGHRGLPLKTPTTDGLRPVLTNFHFPNKMVLIWKTSRRVIQSFSYQPSFCICWEAMLISCPVERFHANTNRGFLLHPEMQSGSLRHFVMTSAAFPFHCYWSKMCFCYQHRPGHTHFFKFCSTDFQR